MFNPLGIEQAIKAVDDGSGANILLTFSINDLEVSIEVANKAQGQQLVSYFRTYTPYELDTLLNLKTWGAARRMKVEFKILRPHLVSSWILKLLVTAYERSEEVREQHPPVRRPKTQNGTQ